MTKIRSYSKFLWLPKEIDGKLYWLRKIRVVETTNSLIIDGKLRTVSSKTEYKIY